MSGQKGRPKKTCAFPNLDRELQLLGISRTEAAAALYMTPGNLCQMLRGVRGMRLDRAMQIRDTLFPGKSLDYLFEMVTPPKLPRAKDPDPAPWSVQIREARLSRGLTQEQAGELIGATRATWEAWEHGDHVPCEYLVKRIKDAFGLDLKVARERKLRRTK